MKNLLLLLSVMACYSGSAQVIYPYRTCTSPAELKEFSGLAKVDDNLLVGINDSGNEPALYFLDTTGKLIRTRSFKHISNIDWEELFFYNGKLYIADIGDNLCQRKKMTVHEYDPVRDTLTGKIVFSFAEKSKPLADKNKHYDCEAGFMAQGKYFLFTKTHAVPYTGKSYQYAIDPLLKEREWKAVDSAGFGTKGFIYNSLTGAALSPDKNTVAFISCTRLWLRFFPEAGKYFNTGWLMEFTFDGLTQKEAITFMSNDRLVVADERTMGLLGGRLYFYNTRAYANGNRTYAHPTAQKAVLKANKGGDYTLEFESSSALKEMTLVWIGSGGKILHTQKFTLKDNKISTQIRYTAPGKPIAFWVTSGNKILYTSKIKKI